MAVMRDQNNLDSMSIFIEMDSEKAEHVDYFFSCDLYGPDPRFKSRFMVIGQCRGLFRIDKLTLEPILLSKMEGDNNNKRFLSAASVVLRKFTESRTFPKLTQFASG